MISIKKYFISKLDEKDLKNNIQLYKNSQEIKNDSEGLDISLYDKYVLIQYFEKLEKDIKLETDIQTLTTQYNLTEISKEEFYTSVENTRLRQIELQYFERDVNNKLKFLNKEYENAILNGLGEEITNDEKATWIIQEKEARLYKQTKNELDCPFVKTLAENRGVSLDGLVNKILEKSKIYNIFVAKLTGQKQKIQDQIETAETYFELNNIDISLK